MRLRLVAYTSDGEQQPVAGAVSMDRAVTTDENGEFTLSPAPAAEPAASRYIPDCPNITPVGELMSYGIDETCHHRRGRPAEGV